MPSIEEFFDTWEYDVQEMLNKAAEEADVLGPGEQIQFTLKVVEIPLAVRVQDEPSRVPWHQVLTKEDFTDALEPSDSQTLASRVFNALTYKFGPSYGIKRNDIASLNDVVSLGRRQLSKVRNLGDSSMALLERVLERKGIEFPS